MTTALALCLGAAGLDGVSAQAAGQAAAQAVPAATAPAERSDDELWNELKALSGSPVEDGLWEAAETATEHVFGSALERETGEKVFETIAAALERDWRGAAQLAGPEILSAYLPGVGQYIELVQSAAQQIDRVTDEWAAQLYDHDSYRWVEEQVAAEYTRLRAPMVDQLNEPFYGYIDDDSYAFMPSYALPVGSQAQIRARAFEAQLFERFMQQPFMDELTATDYTGNGGGVGGLYTRSYPAMVREILGYEPEPRRLFNYFYHRATRQNLQTYFDLHEYVEAEHMRRRARERRQDVIDAYRAALAEQNTPQPYLVMACGSASGFQPGFDGEVHEDEGNRRVREFRTQLYAAAEQNGVDAYAIEAQMAQSVSAGLLTDVAFEFDTSNLEERPLGARYNAPVSLHLTPDILGIVWSGSPASFAGAARTSHLALGKAYLDIGPELLQDRFASVQAVARVEDSAAPLVVTVTGLDYQYAHRLFPNRGIHARLGTGVQVCFEGETLIDTTIRTEEYHVRPNDMSLNSSRAMGVSTMEGVARTLSRLADMIAAQGNPRLQTYLRGEAPQHMLTGAAAERAAQIARGQRRMAAASAPASAPPAVPRSTVERMRELEELREAGMIGADEFERLRSEILGTLTSGD